MPALSIDITMLWQIINFIILIFIFSKFFYKPLKEIIEKRKGIISSELNAAEENKKESEILRSKSEDILKKAREDADEIITIAERKADSRKTEILKEAHTSRDKMLKTAELEVAKMKHQAKKDLENETRKLSVLLAEKIISKNLDPSTNEKLLDDFINNLGEDNEGH